MRNTKLNISRVRTDVFLRNIAGVRKSDVRVRNSLEIGCVRVCVSVYASYSGGGICVCACGVFRRVGGRVARS